MSPKSRTSSAARPQPVDVFRRFAWNLAGTLKKRAASKGRPRRSAAR